MMKTERELFEESIKKVEKMNGYSFSSTERQQQWCGWVMARAALDKPVEQAPSAVDRLKATIKISGTCLDIEAAILELADKIKRLEERG